MLPGLLKTPKDYSFLYFVKINKIADNIKDLAQFLDELSAGEQSVAGFDRLLWSHLSSGQMPSQLYTFNFYGSPYSCEIHEGVLVILSKNELTAFPDYFEFVFKESLGQLEVDEGKIAEPLEVDDEFADCLYGSLLVWDKYEKSLPEVGQVKNLQFGVRLQLMIGKTLYAIDDWVESFFNHPDFNSLNQVAGAVHLLFPDAGKIKGLSEAVEDKEKAHLDPEIKGIYC